MFAMIPGWRSENRLGRSERTKRTLGTGFHLLGDSSSHDIFTPSICDTIPEEEANKKFNRTDRRYTGSSYTTGRRVAWDVAQDGLGVRTTRILYGIDVVVHIIIDLCMLVSQTTHWK